MMKEINELDMLCEDLELSVWKCLNGTESICVEYKGAEVKSGSLLSSAYGSGRTFQEALNDYYEKIKGKTLVFDAYGKNRKEIIII